MINHTPTRIDITKLRIVQNCLTTLFNDLYIGGEFLTLFAVKNDTQTGQLQFHRDFLTACESTETLQRYMETVVIPAMLANPDRRIEIDAAGAITMTPTGFVRR